MATGKALPGMGGGGVAGRTRWRAAWRVLAPLRAVWWLATNVRFAVILLAFLALVSLLGVVLPQMPSNVRGDAFAEADWIEFQEGKFGPLTGPMDRLGLFDVFHARWFAVTMAVMVVSTTAYIASRFPGVWRTITRPRKRVPDRYFQMAPQRLEVAAALDVGALEAALRRGLYRVERFQEGQTTYLFADRFPWAQTGTLLTHAAVVLFIAAAVVSRMDAFSAPLLLAEGSTLPVFPVRDPNQMQVELLDARAAFSEDGQPLDYRSELAVYRDGEAVKRCESTVNSPCGYGGYRFYQAAYFGFGAAVEVRDLTSGNVIYRETLPLSDSVPSPHVIIRDGEGQALVDGPLVLTDVLSTDEFVYYGTIVRLPGERLLTVGAQRPAEGGGDWRLAVLEPAEGAGAVRLRLGEGETARAGGLEFSYVSSGKAPAALVDDLPLPPSAERGGPGPVLVQMSNVVYGTSTASEGTRVETPVGEGPPELTLSGLRPQAAKLRPGAAVTVGEYQYRFLGQREFAGIEVKRDRSDNLIWVGAGLMFVGLALTFWVPRRRLWARIAAGRTFLAGQAANRTDYTPELRRLARQAGAPQSAELEDDD